MTLERGAPADIRAAVAQAVEILGRERFVLSPIDNITVDDPLTWENISILIDEWKKRR